MTTWEEIGRILLIGVGATIVMDAWTMLMKRLGVPTLNWAFAGRWVGHLFQGKFAHERIGHSPPIPGELALGWFTHYAVGVAFAALLAGIQGQTWLHTPTLLPALTLGIATVAVPLFVMQPAMGAGFASAKTPTPTKNCLRSLATHAVFGLGLYLSAVVIARV